MRRDAKTRPGASGEEIIMRPGGRISWALVLYLFGVVLIVAFLGFPMYQITEIFDAEGDRVTRTNGLEFLRDAWRIVTGSVEVGIPPLPAIPWWLVNAPVMLLVVVSTIPSTGLIWLAERSKAASWLGRIWWALLFFVGPFWYLWESGPDPSIPVVYEQLIGMNLMVFGTFLIAAAFWVTRPGGAAFTRPTTP